MAAAWDAPASRAFKTRVLRNDASRRPVPKARSAASERWGRQFRCRSARALGGVLAPVMTGGLAGAEREFAMPWSSLRRRNPRTVLTA